MRAFGSNVMKIMPLMLLLMLCGCGGGGNSFKLKGNIEGMKGGEIYIYNISDEHSSFDTVTIKDGKFVYEGPVDAPTPYFIIYPNAVEQVFFADKGDKLKYRAKANDLKNYSVEGNKENELYSRFRAETANDNESKQRNAARDFINMNPETATARLLFTTYFLNGDDKSKEASTLLNTLRKAQKDNIELMMAEGILKQKGISNVGKSIPSITVKSKQGKELNLAKPGKEWLMLVFWASWQENESLDFVDALKKQAEFYSNRVRFVAISLDSQIYKWERLVKNDSINVFHCNDGMAWESETVKKLGIGRVPCFMLVDKDNKIVTKGSTVKEFSMALDKYVRK